MGEPIEDQQQAERGDGDEVVDEPQADNVDEAELAAAGGGESDDELEQRLGAELGDDSDGESDDELEQQQPQAQQPSEAEVEETYKRLDKETARHVKRIAELVGDAFAFLVPCELCDPAMPGFRWPREPADEVKVAVRYAIGDRQPENWQPDQYSRRCDACDGLGEVLTGSKVQGKGTLPCLACGGNGWQPIGNERRGGGAQVVQLTATPPGNPPAVAVSVDDPPEVAALKAAGYVVIRPAAGE